MANTLNANYPLHRLIGRWRLLIGFCPRCNGDAPAVDSCACCKNVITGSGQLVANIRQQYPPTRATKALWWYTWMLPGFNAHQIEVDKLHLKRLGRLNDELSLRSKEYWLEQLKANKQ